MEITADMTYGEVAELPEFLPFGEHIMLCRPTTWERLRALRIGEGAVEPWQQYEVGRVVRGLNHIKELVDSGHEVAYDIWDARDCVRDPSRRQVKLFFMPGAEGAPFVLILSGGGYMSVCNNTEGFAMAPEFNEAGYNVFVLSYRVRMKPLMPRPYDDVAQALRYILAHAGELGVGQRYAVLGTSAGGHLAAEWGTQEHGYAHYGLPKPELLALGYAIVDFDLLGDALDPRIVDTVSERADHSDLVELSVLKHMWDGYPATYLWHCADDDAVLPANCTSMCQALEQRGIAHAARIYEHGGHGFMKPHDPAETQWLADALPFFGEFLGM